MIVGIAVQISTMYPDSLVLGADQTLQFGDELVSKCTDIAAARSLLGRLRGETHRLISALALAQNGKMQPLLADQSGHGEGECTNLGKHGGPPALSRILNP